MRRRARKREKEKSCMREEKCMDTDHKMIELNILMANMIKFLLQENVFIPDGLCERLLASHLGYFSDTCSNKKTRLYRGEREEAQT